MLNKESCNSCHHNKREDCQACHPVQERFRKGFKVLDYDSIPAPMSDLGCRDCHTEIAFQKTSWMVREACKNCHDEDYIGILDDQQKDKKSQLQEIKDELTQLNKKERLSSQQKKKIDYILERLNLMEKDNSFGGHNQNLDDQMMADIKRAMKELE